MQDVTDCVQKLAQHIGSLMLSPASGIAVGDAGRPQSADAMAAQSI